MVYLSLSFFTLSALTFSQIFIFSFIISHKEYMYLTGLNTYVSLTFNEYLQGISIGNLFFNSDFISDFLRKLYILSIIYLLESHVVNTYESFFVKSQSILFSFMILQIKFIAYIWESKYFFAVS